MGTIALIVTDAASGFFGHSARLSDELAGRSVLAHTVARARRVEGVERVVVVYPAGQEPRALLAAEGEIETLAIEAGRVGCVPVLASARKWATACWRGGLGGASVYDELLPAAPILTAMEACDAASAVIVRGDWCLFDPELAGRQLAVHAEAPERLALCFSQAPPGLGAVVAHREVIREIAKHEGPEGGGASFGGMLGYHPRRPQLDPIGREVCVPVEPAVRDAGRRFVYDLPRSMARVRRVAAVLGEGMVEADAGAVVRAVGEAVGADQTLRRGLLSVGVVGVSRGEEVERAEVVTVELTPRRPVDGPIVPRVDRGRGEMSEPVAVGRVREAAAGGESAILLGGSGDALLHPAWERVIDAAQEAGALGVGIETDLLCDHATVDRLAALGRSGVLDLVSVRLNADTAQTYRRVMGVDGFPRVFDNLRRLIAARGEPGKNGIRHRLPWIVVRLIKTADTLGDLESFFTRWSRVAGVQPVIDGPSTGCGLARDASVVAMEPPRRRACRQLGRRLTVLSDGRPTMCDRDWLGVRPLGGAEESLSMAWSRVAVPLELHSQGRWDEVEPCDRCRDWFRP